MAFNYLNWQQMSSGFDIGNNKFWNYSDTVTDNIATISAANFFSSQAANLSVGDLIWLVATDLLTGEFAQVTVVNKITGAVSIAVFNAVLGAGSVGTANLANLAVTAAKIANNTITDAQVAVNGLTSASLDKTTIQYVKVPVTAAQWNGMYAAPFLMIAAPAAGQMIVVKQAIVAMTFVATQYAAGGNVALQYDSTVNGGGLLATLVPIPAAVINAWAASSDVGIAGDDENGASANKVAKGLYLSNDTAAFTTGNGTFNIHIWYEVITL